eukprot:6484220-Amphidinium_carterae.1
MLALLEVLNDMVCSKAVDAVLAAALLATQKSRKQRRCPTRLAFLQIRSVFPRTGVQLNHLSSMLHVCYSVRHSDLRTCRGLYVWVRVATVYGGESALLGKRVQQRHRLCLRFPQQ